MQNRYNYVFDDLTNAYNFTTKNDILYRVAFLVDETFSAIAHKEIPNVFQLDIEKITVQAAITANQYLYNSDIRYKSDTTPLANSLDKILALRGYSYHNKLSGSSDIGVIAQQIEQVFPELVHTDEDGYKSVQYGNLVAPLIEAVKELHATVQDQQAQIDSLVQALDY